MKEYIAIIRLSAECEDDFKEIMDCYEQEHPLELDIWYEVNDNEKQTKIE